MVGTERFDVMVVGAGPAGSIAALVLARGGARVALVDKASFPRDKACGDLVGPRGVRTLADLGVHPRHTLTVDDMVVVGPTGRRVRLPCYPGTTYPGHAIAIPRRRLDALLRDAAVVAGAVPLTGRADRPVHRDGALEGFELAAGPTVVADVVIGADGATSRVAQVAGLVDPTRVMWGFAVRSYTNDGVAVPHIYLWEPRPRHALPGYGWVFPGADGETNVGLGVGVLADRRAGAEATRLFDRFLDHVAPSGRPGPRLGGWLKLGMVGTRPTDRDGRVLLVGDAAGLVNPLQGEGISQAVASGRAAAEAVLAGPADAAHRYRSHLAATLAPYLTVTAPAHRALLPHPRAVSAVGRLVTAPVIGDAIAGGWSIFWNDLLDGARPGRPRAVASAAQRAGRLATTGSRSRRWLEDSIDGLNAVTPPSPTRRRRS
jgi:geranylgeranyl reductase family protein